jgi:hypothetical protein
VTYTPATVSPPARLPWDVAAVAQAALDVLRLDPADEDAARITSAAQSATELIDAELDYDGGPPSAGWDYGGWSSTSSTPVGMAAIPGPVFDAAVTLTVELYRRKDAPFGVTDSWSVDGASIRISSDVMTGTRSMLAPYVSRRGIG